MLKTEVSLVERLEDLGFPGYDARVLIAMVFDLLHEENGGSLTTWDIARRAGIPRTSVYVVLRRLENRGLVRVAEHKPIMRWRARPRAMIQHQLRLEIEREKSRKIRTLEALPW